MDVAVQHEGEYVLTSSGSKDFGEITPEIARIIKRQSGKIRLRVGLEIKGNKGNYGEKHIERHLRLEQMRAAGFECARDLVEFICRDFDEIYENGMDLLLYKYGRKDALAYVELTPMTDGEFYDVKTALPTRRTFIKNKTPIWSKKNKSEKITPPRQKP